MLVALSSPGQLSSPKLFFGVKFHAKFETVLQKQFLLVVVNHSKSDFSTVTEWHYKIVKCTPQKFSQVQQ